MCAHVVVAGRARTRKRRRNVSALARWGKGFRFAPAGRGGVERSWNVKKEEKQEEERSPGVDRCSKRIEREAIRECLMPRTKLCNYLYVRQRPSWLARARVLACICGAMSCPCGGASRTSTRIIPLVHPRMLANVRICVSIGVCVPTIHHSLHLSPKAHKRHISWTPIMLLPTTSNESRQTTPQLLEYNNYYYLPLQIILRYRSYNYSVALPPYHRYI